MHARARVSSHFKSSVNSVEPTLKSVEHHSYCVNGSPLGNAASSQGAPLLWHLRTRTENRGGGKFTDLKQVLKFNSL